MANFKIKHTTVADELDHMFELTSDAAISAIRAQMEDRWAVARISLTESDNTATSPHLESAVNSTTSDGRQQRVKIWTGFETQEEVSGFVNYIWATAPSRGDVAAFSIANDVRTKIEMLDDNNNSIQVFNDTTTSPAHTVNGYVSSPADPFYVEA